MSKSNALQIFESHHKELSENLSLVNKLLDQKDNISFDEPIVIGADKIEDEDQLLNKKIELEAEIKVYEFGQTLFKEVYTQYKKLMKERHDKKTS